MKLQIVFFLFVCSLFLKSCNTLDGYQRSVGNRFSGKNTGLENKIRLDGFYVNYSKTKNYADVLLFYPDGGHVSFSVEGENDDEIRNVILDYAKAYGYNNKTKRWEDYFGVYEYQNDTIESCFYTPNKFHFLPSSLSFYWWMRRSKFCIVNDELIKMYADAQLVRLNEEDFSICEKLYHFVPFADMPSSDMRMKRKRWLWANEDAWKEYKQESKNK